MSTPVFSKILKKESFGKEFRWIKFILKFFLKFFFEKTISFGFFWKTPSFEIFGSLLKKYFVDVFWKRKFSKFPLTEFFLKKIFFGKKYLLKFLNKNFGWSFFGKIIFWIKFFYFFMKRNIFQKNFLGQIMSQN